MLNNPVTSAATPKGGLCPHGLPPSACPICSNMGGGGGKKTEFNFKSAPTQMMSWNQCEAIGFFLKGQRKGVERRHEMFKTLALNLAFQATQFGKLAARLEQIVQMFNSTLPGMIIAVPIRFILLPITKTLHNSLNKMADISDKIAAIIGELKKGLEKAKENLIKFAKEIKNKFFKLFTIFGASKSDENEKQIDEEKRIFNVNKFIKILQLKKKQDNNET